MLLTFWCFCLAASWHQAGSRFLLGHWLHLSIYTGIQPVAGAIRKNLGGAGNGKVQCPLPITAGKSAFGAALPLNPPSPFKSC